MRYFHKLSVGQNFVALVNALVRQPHLWNVNTLRTTFAGSPHFAVDDIWLRFNDLTDFISIDKSRHIIDKREAVDYAAMQALPQARDWIFNLMRLVEGERLGRVLVTRLAPGKVIPPHIDGDTHAGYYDRYHMALQVKPGVQFQCGGEIAPMVTGDVWWINNQVEHSVTNNSDDDRLVMIVDVRTKH